MKEKQWVGWGVREKSHQKPTSNAEKEEVQSKDNVNNRAVIYNMAGDS